MSDYLKRSSSKQVINVNSLIAEPGATAGILDFKDPTDPKYIGPGTWNVIHRFAFRARTHNEQLQFIREMKETCYGFPCSVCKNHCTEYIKNHPMDEYLNVLVDINGQKLPLGMFVWTWKFHNAVNARLKKPIMSWDTAYNLYSETESLVCSKNCLEAENIQDDNSTHNSHSSRNSHNESNKFTTVPKIPDYKVSIPDQSFRLISSQRKY